MERTLKNGYTYYFYELFKGYVSVECFYNGKWNRITKSFSSMDEASSWCDEMDCIYEQSVSKSFV